jgi:regulator of cell morphogenesis and NO signaling
MSVTAEKTVWELAVENPAATQILEKLGIDYCCGGNQSMDQACRAANLPVDKVLDSLEMAEQSLRSAQGLHDWQREPLGDLVAQINSTHHQYTLLCSGRRVHQLADALQSLGGTRSGFAPAHSPGK